MTGIPLKMFRTGMFLCGFLALTTPFLQAESLKLRDVQKEHGFALIPAFFGGYNALLNGYDGYENMENMGFDLYMRFPREAELPAPFHDRFLGRLSVDYFPLEVPKGVYGIKEEIVAVTYGVDYQFILTQRGLPLPWFPFVGLAAGVYQDRVTLDTPATGKRLGHSSHFGWNASAGIMLPKVKVFVPIRLIPEVRYHVIDGVGHSATNISYQVAISFWPNEKE